MSCCTRSLFTCCDGETDQSRLQQVHCDIVQLDTSQLSLRAMLASKFPTGACFPAPSADLQKCGLVIFASVAHRKILFAQFFEGQTNQPATRCEKLMPYSRRLSGHPFEPLFDHSGVSRGIFPRNVIVNAFAVRTRFFAESSQSGIERRIRKRIQQTPPLHCYERRSFGAPMDLASDVQYSHDSAIICSFEDGDGLKLHIAFF
jgi:hypothetical protein